MFWKKDSPQDAESVLKQEDLEKDIPISTSEISLDGDREYLSEYADEYNPAGCVLAKPEDASRYRNITTRPDVICMLILVVEFAERGSYYGTQGVLNNFIMRPLPLGSTTGRTSEPNASAGALGLGLKDANALVTLLAFLAYVMPLYGGWLADAKLGRYKTIMIGVWVGIFSHILFIISALPPVIAKGQAALAPLILGILSLSVCTGMIKPNLLPLLLDQVPYKHNVLKKLETGETVYVNTEHSTESLTLFFYWSINIGAFLSIGTSYAARRVGFWLAFLAPAIIYALVVLAMLWIRKYLKEEEIYGSLLGKLLRVIKVCVFNGNPIKRLRNGTFWEYAYPENLLAGQENTSTTIVKTFSGEKTVPIWKGKTIDWSAQDVREFKSTLIQCIMFAFWVPFLLNDSGLGSTLNAQAGAMTLNGVPNDLFNNFNQITIVVAIPIIQYVLYPGLKKLNINYRPVHKIFVGFMLGCFSTMTAAILQHKIYQTSPCGNFASTCEEVSTVLGWYEVIVYALAALGECFCMPTGYEISYTRAPYNAKGLVMSLFLFNSAISAAINEAVSGALNDPHLVWTFAGLCIGSAAVAFLFLFCYWNLHKTMEREFAERELAEKEREDERNEMQLTAEISRALSK